MFITQHSIHQKTSHFSFKTRKKFFDEIDEGILGLFEIIVVKYKCSFRNQLIVVSRRGKKNTLETTR